MSGKQGRRAVLKSGSLRRRVREAGAGLFDPRRVSGGGGDGGAVSGGLRGLCEGGALVLEIALSG